MNLQIEPRAVPNASLKLGVSRSPVCLPISPSHLKDFASGVDPPGGRCREASFRCIAHDYLPVGAECLSCLAAMTCAVGSTTAVAMVPTAIFSFLRPPAGAPRQLQRLLSGPGATPAYGGHLRSAPLRQNAILHAACLRLTARYDHPTPKVPRRRSRATTYSDPRHVSCGPAIGGAQRMEPAGFEPACCDRDRVHRHA